MKKKFLLLPLVGAFVYLTMSSSDTGYNQNRTGSHGGQVGCGTCHGSSATTGVTVTVELDSAGTPVTRYKPGIAYTIKLKGTNTTSNTLPQFGMELSVVSGSGTSSANAGTFSGTPSTVRTFTSSGITYLSHNTPISATTGTGGSGTTYEISATWTAPAAGTGTVTAFGLINAVNGDGRDASSDKWNTGSASFTEIPAATGIENISNTSIAVYPNPVVNQLNIEGITGAFHIYDLNGRTIANGNADGNTTVNTTDWAPGLYVVRFGEQAITVIKK